MAVMLNNTVGVKLATVDISDAVSSATLSQIFDELEVTTLGDNSHVFTKGLEASTLTLDFYNDFEASKITTLSTKLTTVLLSPPY